MTRMEKNSAFVGVSRRSLLQTGGALVVSVGMPVAFDTVLAIDSAAAQGAKPPLTPDQLSSYIAINADGTVSASYRMEYPDWWAGNPAASKAATARLRSRASAYALYVLAKGGRGDLSRLRWWHDVM